MRDAHAVSLTIPLHIALFPANDSVRIQIGKSRIDLKKGEWSSWQEVEFKLGWFKSIAGIVRFYLKRVSPELELYMTPVNFDPRKPFYPLSYPQNLATQLAKKIGLFYTQGMPHDTWALTEGVLDDTAFLAHADMILSEKERILKEELNRFKRGVFVFYFDTLDMIQHMFWRFEDRAHPLYEQDSPYAKTIERYYQRIDRIVGEIMASAGKDTVLMVVSDHGFTSFRKSVHLNRWLFEHGYLSLKDGVQEGGDLLGGIDWSRTRAYALGFGGIYLNKIGREYLGVISEQESKELTDKIVYDLRQFQDAETGTPVVSTVYRAADVFHGPFQKDAPDIFVGFASGYRASWQTALGGTPARLIEKNEKKWGGDHLVDPQLVPGVFFMNRKIQQQALSLYDAAPSILKIFNVAIPATMKGRPVVEEIDTKNK